MNNEYLYNVEKNLNDKELLNTKKNELELLLSENKIQLCSISLSQKQVEEAYRKEPNNLYLNNLQYLHRRYNEKELEIRKINEALEFLNNQINLIKVMQVEQNESNLYNKIDYETSEIELPSVGITSKIESQYFNENNEDELDRKIDELELDINQILFEISVSKHEVLKGYGQEAYINTFSAIKKLITLELLLEKYLSESKINKKLIELKEQLKYTSARFISYKDIDSSLYSKVLGLSLKIEYSLNPEEVATAYIEREKIYKENGYLEKINNYNEKLSMKSDSEYNSDPKKIELDNIINNLKILGIEVSDDEIKEIKDLLG